MKKVFLIIVGVLILSGSAWGGQDFKGTVNNNTISTGSADLKQFMNAAGTDREWANGMKLGRFTYDLATANGSQSITGVGFKPSMVIFLSGVAGTTVACTGIDNGTIANALGFQAGYGAGLWANQSDASLYMVPSAGNYATGHISAFEADGFIIAWGKAGSPTGVADITYLAFR